MKIDIYDTYIKNNDGTQIHFDILLPQGEGLEKAKTCAYRYLKDIDEITGETGLESCQFCHSELASPELREQVIKNGHVMKLIEDCSSLDKSSS